MSAVTNQATTSSSSVKNTKPVNKHILSIEYVHSGTGEVMLAKLGVIAEFEDSDVALLNLLATLTEGKDVKLFNRIESAEKKSGNTDGFL